MGRGSTAAAAGAGRMGGPSWWCVLGGCGCRPVVLGSLVGAPRGVWRRGRHCVGGGRHWSLRAVWCGRWAWRWWGLGRRAGVGGGGGGGGGGVVGCWWGWRWGACGGGCGVGVVGWWGVGGGGVCGGGRAGVWLLVGGGGGGLCGWWLGRGGGVVGCWAAGAGVGWVVGRCGAVSWRGMCVVRWVLGLRCGRRGTAGAVRSAVGLRVACRGVGRRRRLRGVRRVVAREGRRGWGSRRIGCSVTCVERLGVGLVGRPPGWVGRLAGKVRCSAGSTRPAVVRRWCGGR